MPNVKRADLEALRNMVSQANLIVTTEPMLPGGAERLRELLGTAERLADFLFTDSRNGTNTANAPNAKVRRKTRQHSV